MQCSEVKYGTYPELTSVRTLWGKTKRQLSGSQNRTWTHWGLDQLGVLAGRRSIASSCSTLSSPTSANIHSACGMTVRLGHTMPRGWRPAGPHGRSYCVKPELWFVPLARGMNKLSCTTHGSQLRVVPRSLQKVCRSRASWCAWSARAGVSSGAQRAHLDLVSSGARTS